MRKHLGRILGISALAVSCAAFAVGCGKGKEDKSVEIDTKALAQELQDSKVFSGKLELIDESATSFMVQAEEGTKVELYMGQDGSKADELLIMTGEDASSTEANKKAAETHAKDIAASFEDYIPEEAAKADDAVLVDQDKYVVLCIANDTDAAKEIINRYLSGNGKTSDAGDSENKDDSASAPPEADGNKEDVSQKPQAQEYEKIESQGSVKKYGGVVTVDNAGYELYDYHEGAGKNYGQLVSKVADSLKGQADVYDLIPPTSVAITFPDNLRDQISSSNQQESLEKLHGFMSDSVKSVDAYNNLMKHRTEYIYFRTDHHWTALGAYYAYQAFCEEKGIAPHEISEYQTKEFEGFLGSFYKDTDKSSDLGNTPDTIRAYLPLAQNVTLDVTDQKGQNYSWDVVHDVNDYGAALKYSTFIAGDNPMTVIKNPNLSDGSTCVVVKESFGNALVPFLIDHYQTIYVIDYRYWSGDIVSFAKEKKAGDVLFINNISMTRSDFLVGKLAKVIK